MGLLEKLEAISLQTGHAALSPSQLPRVMKCTASPHESTYAPIPAQSEYAALGELKHKVVEVVWAEGESGLNKFPTLTLDDKNHVLDAIDYLRRVLAEYATVDDTKLILEAKVSLESFGLPMIWGTSDVVISSVELGRADIIDWKFGQGVQVYAENNEQCLAYAAGAVKHPNLFFKDVHLHIAQPPLNHYDVWQVDDRYVEDWVFQDLQQAIEKIFSESEMKYVAGEKQCRFCPASMTCKERHVLQLKNAEDIFSGYAILPQTTKEQLAALLKKGKELKLYIKQIEAFAEEEILKGRAFPGKKAVRGRSTRKWADEVTAFNWLNKYAEIKVEKLYTKKFISPAQAEKLSRELKKDKDFKSLVVKPEGKLIVVDADDKREAVELTGPAESVFKELVE